MLSLIIIELEANEISILKSLWCILKNVCCIKVNVNGPNAKQNNYFFFDSNPVKINEYQTNGNILNE